MKDQEDRDKKMMGNNNTSQNKLWAQGLYGHVDLTQ